MLGFALTQVFLAVVLLGLFHGLVFLPILLSWVGPTPYLSAEKDSHVNGNAAIRDTIENGHQPSAATGTVNGNESAIAYVNHAFDKEEKENTNI